LVYLSKDGRHGNIYSIHAYQGDARTEEINCLAENEYKANRELDQGLKHYN
jgi:hypothetical protein